MRGRARAHVRLELTPRPCAQDELLDQLASFVTTVAERGGVSHFAVHARQAVLGGLSPAQNRQVPPLHYGVVERLAVALPHLSFSLNGGVEELERRAFAA